MPKTVQRIHQEGSGRYGSQRWSGLILELIEALKEQDIDPTTPEAQELIAQAAKRVGLYAWGAETAHTIDKPCSQKSVGIIIYRGDDLLLIERLTGGIGMACPAGHVEEGEDDETSVRRETFEETGLTVTNLHLLAEGRRHEKCKRWGSTFHDWRVYRGEVEDFDARHNPTEAKRLIFASPEQVAALTQRTEEYLQHLISDEDWLKQPGFERVWYWWLHSLNILPRIPAF